MDCCENLACRKSSRKEAGACVYEPLALIEAESENGSSRSLVRSGETADDSTCVERNHHVSQHRNAREEVSTVNTIFFSFFLTVR